MAPGSASREPRTQCGQGRDAGSARLGSYMAQTPDADPPKRANVGPRQAVESSGIPSPTYAAPAQGSGSNPSGIPDPERRTGVLSFLYVNVGPWAELRQLAGEDYDTVLADLQLLIRNEVTNSDGRELGTGKDGFLAVFSSPNSSVVAALRLRRAIASWNWPRGEMIRARMGLHTGESKKTVDGFLNLDASRAEEIAAVSHAGQVVLSGATASLLATSVPDGIRLSDLGLHRLRDLGHPERLFQVEEEGERSEFPPFALSTIRLCCTIFRRG